VVGTFCKAGVLGHDCFFFSILSKIILFLFHFTPSVPNMEGHNLILLLLDVVEVLSRRGKDSQGVSDPG
jgi:hypothetical protein